MRLRFVYLYLFLIPFVNWSFAHVPTIPMPDGGLWAPMALVTGLILVFRDFAQREVGHYVFIPLLLGIAISFEMAGKEIAIYSALAFAISEFVDWCIYSFTKKPFSSRIMLSSAVSAPLDTTVFFMGANIVAPGIFNWSTILTSIASKLLGAYLVFLFIRRHERAIPSQTRG
jgi:uncharacterized PurR-regulated membrane protein YhhQ (DUF165 family)